MFKSLHVQVSCNFSLICTRIKHKNVQLLLIYLPSSSFLSCGYPITKFTDETYKFIDKNTKRNCCMFTYTLPSTITIQIQTTGH